LCDFSKPRNRKIHVPNIDGTAYKCDICGRFELSSAAKLTLEQDHDGKLRYPLSWLINNLPNADKQPIEDRDINDLVDRAKLLEPSLSGKARLLQEFFRKSSGNEFGAAVSFDPSRHWPQLKMRVMANANQSCSTYSLKA
jgi:hypothetical protein